MKLEPSAVVLYVDHLEISSKFYQDILEKEPEEASPTFHSFILSNGMALGLKVKDTVQPAAESNNGSGELAFILENNQQVDTIFAEWQKKKIHIAMPPTVVPYGYTFLALDPNGNRLRVVALQKL